MVLLVLELVFLFLEALPTLRLVEEAAWREEVAWPNFMMVVCLIEMMCSVL